jgi:hypothetical protein
LSRNYFWFTKSLAWLLCSLLINDLTCNKSNTTTRRVSLVDQEMPTLPEHIGFTPVFNRVHVVVVCPFSFWPLYYLFFFNLWLLITSLWNRQTVLTDVTVPRQESEWSWLWICAKGRLIFRFLFNVLQIAVCPFYYSDCVVCLLMTSDYHFVIFKFFLLKWLHHSIKVWAVMCGQSWTYIYIKG